ncbi:MAG: hypothetical protein ACXAC7_18775 [Candidatus Hodarchaeales archaeon]|jgi:hypothetical protein
MSKYEEDMLNLMKSLKLFYREQSKLIKDDFNEICDDCENNVSKTEVYFTQTEWKLCENCLDTYISDEIDWDDLIFFTKDFFGVDFTIPFELEDKIKEMRKTREKPIKSDKDKVLEFKFKFVKDKEAKGLFAKDGKVTDSYILLNEEKIQLNSIVDTITRKNRLVFELNNTEDLNQKTQEYLLEGTILIIEVSKVKAIDLERRIDYKSSKIHSELNKKRLIDLGEGHKFRYVLCPNCKATLDLSELKETEYFYCRYCESIFNQKKEMITNSEKFRLCDECGMFSRVKYFTEFYFYFLLLIYGFSYNERSMCNTCALKIAKKTLLLNLIFIIGIPFSIYMWIKAKRGDEESFKSLSKANRLAKEGRMDLADPIYNEILKELPHHPGILYNMGQSNIIGGKTEEGLKALIDSLDSCCNYSPTISVLSHIKSRSINANLKIKQPIKKKHESKDIKPSICPDCNISVHHTLESCPNCNTHRSNFKY